MQGTMYIHTICLTPLESRVLWARVPPEAANFSLEKSCLGCRCVVLFVVSYVVHVYIHLTSEGSINIGQVNMSCEWSPAGIYTVYIAGEKWRGF